jgi:hypothetical protein
MCAKLFLCHAQTPQHKMLDLVSKLSLLRKRVKSSRLHLLKEEQKLSKLRWDLGTVTYKKHMLSQEKINLTHGPALGVSWGTHALTFKCANFRKALLKEEQKLAKKRWELACCKTKLDALDSVVEIDV